MDMAMLLGSLVPIVAILFAGLIVLIPIAGLTLRFALKPAIESYVRLRSSPDQDRLVSVLEQRLTLVEQQLHQVESTLRGIEEKRDFDQRLVGGPATRPEDAARAVPVFRSEV
jgi:hypothetical protein